jgi:hypothetical protein
MSCGSRCQSSKSSRCRCSCGGANHGGKQQLSLLVGNFHNGPEPEMPEKVVANMVPGDYIAGTYVDLNAGSPKPNLYLAYSAPIPMGLLVEADDD